MLLTTAWPAHDSCSHIYDGRQRYYRTTEGVFPGVTSVLKVLGLSTEGLIGWAAGLEREACLAAVREAYREELLTHPGHFITPESMTAAVERRLGKERAHAKALEKAGDIGTQVHDRIRWTLAAECGMERGPEPQLSEPAMRAFISWTDWWRGSGLKPVRCEQPLWDPVLGYAGTCDLIAEGPSGLQVLDWKSGKGIYLEYHLQAMAYVHAARRHAPVVSATLVRLPKTAGEVFHVERDVETLGDHKYSGRVMSQGQLLEAFTSALTCWNLLAKNPKFNPEAQG